MSSRRGRRPSRAVSNSASDVREQETQVISRNVEINLNGAPGVVCQMQDHAQGTEETIEVLVIPKRRPHKLIVRLEDESPEDSMASPTVVVTTSRSFPAQQGNRHEQTSRGRNDENVAPSGNDDDGEDRPASAGKKDYTPGTSKNKAGDRKSRFLDEPARPRSATFDFARRISQLVPWKSSRAANQQPAGKGKAKDSGNRREPSRKYHTNRKGADHDYRSGRPRPSQTSTPTTDSFDTSARWSVMEDFEHCCLSCGRARCGYIQIERPVLVGEKIRPSLCSSCQIKLNSGRHKILGPDGRDLSETYWCDFCGFRRSNRFHALHGPPGIAPLKEENKCSSCRREESHREEERQRKIDNLQAKLTRRNTKLNEKIADPTTISHDHHCHHRRPAEQDKTTRNLSDSPSSTYWSSTNFSASENARPVNERSQFASNNTNNNNNHRAYSHVYPSSSRLAPTSVNRNIDTTNHSHSRPPSHVSSSSPFEPDSYHGRTARPHDDATISVSSHGKDTKPATRGIQSGHTTPGYPSAHGYGDDGSDVVIPNTMPLPSENTSYGPSTSRVEAKMAISEDENQDTAASDTDGGFINNPEAAWAKLDIDDVLRSNLEMDPAERRARMARYYHGYRPPSVESDAASSTGQGVYTADIQGPRIVEIDSDEED